MAKLILDEKFKNYLLSAYQEKTISNIQEVRARNGRVLVISNFDDENLRILISLVIWQKVLRPIKYSQP